MCFSGIELDSFERISGTRQCARACFKNPFCMYVNHFANGTCILMVRKNFYYSKDFELNFNILRVVLTASLLKKIVILELLFLKQKKIRKWITRFD